MQQPLYTALKVNNEIELCEVNNPECKRLIERALLNSRISYYMRWPKTSIFSRKKGTCIICVNDNVREAAEEIVRNICDEGGYHVKFIMKRSSSQWF